MRHFVIISHGSRKIKEIEFGNKPPTPQQLRDIQCEEIDDWVSIATMKKQEAEEAAKMVGPIEVEVKEMDLSP